MKLVPFFDYNLMIYFVKQIVMRLRRKSQKSLISQIKIEITQIEASGGFSEVFVITR